MMELKPEVLKGFNHEDARGLLSYNNNLNLSGFKRLYVIENSADQPFRGWHGHEFESKIFITISGRIRFGAVRVKDWENPDPLAKPIAADLDSSCADAFFVPGGYANSILALEPRSQALVLSSSSLKESLGDDHRIPPQFWYL
jgi:dTDP-4-dehydrorhamnose 3,5-epimerase